MNQFQSLRDYERFIYTIPSQFAEIASSTLIIQRRGRLFAELTGELLRHNGSRMIVYERLAWDVDSVRIVGYGYEA